MLISEIYQSRQGEGLLTGTDSVFIRTSGCNLRCDFCDTPFTSWQPSGQTMTVPEMVARLDTDHAACRHVVITGGEPMLPNDLPNLCDELSQQGKHVTIETAGTVFRDLPCDLMSISPKMSNSTPPESRAGRWRERHEQTRLRPQIVSQLIERYDYQLKFVVDQPKDIDEIIDYLGQISVPHDSNRVLLMPQGVTAEALAQKEKWLGPICEQHGFTLCRRRHIEWYGNTRGT